MRKLIVLCALLFAVRASAAIPSTERDALVALYQSTNGTSWINKTNWNGQAGSECDWYGVKCDFERLNVTALELGDNNLDGTLPPSIRNLTKLQAIFMQSNNLRGQIPPEIGDLSNLEVVYMIRNHFSGLFPVQFGNLKKLKALSLDENELTGVLPPQIGDMTALEEIALSNNHFEGLLPADLARLANIRIISISLNQFTGGIPAAFGTMAKLEHFFAAGNLLSGELPPQLGDLSALIDLRLNSNRLTGGIPSTFGKLRSLEHFDASGNQFSGSLTSALGDLPAIKFLALSDNQFGGPLPQSLFRLTTLEHLNLCTNTFTGELSPDVGDLVHLQELLLCYNGFSGPIPIRLGTLPELDTIALQRNELSGSIPSVLGDLPKLEALDLSDNDLTGTIPRELGRLSKLENLSLTSNDLEGTIPSDLGNLTSLRLLYLESNRLRGTIPDALRKLTKLEQFSVKENALSGPLPSWIGEWPLLEQLYVAENQFSGNLPAGLATLENLVLLDLAINGFTGPLVDFTRLTKLGYVTVNYNEFSGPFPRSIGGLTNLAFASFDNNHFSGPLPAEIGNLVNVEFISLQDNEFEGPIPPEISKLKKAYNISLHSNHFSGPLPKELGELTALQNLGVGFNALRGEIPFEITRMVGLLDHASDFSYNGLYATDERVRAFVNLKQNGGDFEETQTVRPTNIRLVETTDRSATLAWDPIRYSYYGGGYQVIASTTPNGAPAVVTTSGSKTFDSITVRNLAPSTTYFFTVATVSHPISGQENLIVSDRSSPIQGTTKQRVIAPADVALVDAPDGMVQIDGVAIDTDSFTVANFGDVATAITINTNDTFFTITPREFTLGAGASQIVVLRSLPQPVGTYYGYIGIDGVGTPDDLATEVVLLSSARPAGSVVATPVATRLELAGAAGSEQIGTAQFRNTGTARLTGIILSDQPWVIVPPESITIDPGSVGSVNFRVARSRRAATEGGLVANLTLIYVSGGASLKYDDIVTHDGTGVSVSKVTIVDVTKPPVTTGPIPALPAGQLAFFIAGVASSTSAHADVSIINAAAASAINDLKLYFTNGPQTSVASMQPLGFAKAVALPNIVNSIYGNASAIGSLQIRSSESTSLASEGKVTAVTSAGTYTGSIPVFRGDRSIGSGASLYLTGLSSPGDLFVQETSGGSSNIHIDLRDASGNLVSGIDQSVNGYSLLELPNAIPANVTTAVIRNLGSGLVTGYARLRDTNGDTWSVVDWSRFYGYALDDAVRIPFADGAQPGTGGRRRAVRANAIASSSTTDVVLYNPGTAEAKATMTMTGGSDREVTIPAGATIIVANAGGLASAATVSLVVTPTKGTFAVTARSHHSKGGSAIPVLPIASGLRLGQSQIFANLDDSSSVRTSYGMTESSGKSAKVRVRIIIDETSPLTATTTSKTFDLAANAQLFLPELVRSFAGDLRDTLFGDLHNLTLEFEVTEGDGSVVPFIIATDVASGDTNVIVQ